MCTESPLLGHHPTALRGVTDAASATPHRRMTAVVTSGSSLVGVGSPEQVAAAVLADPRDRRPGRADPRGRARRAATAVVPPDARPGDRHAGRPNGAVRRRAGRPGTGSVRAAAHRCRPAPAKRPPRRPLDPSRRALPLSVARRRHGHVPSGRFWKPYRDRRAKRLTMAVTSAMPTVTSVANCGVRHHGTVAEAQVIPGTVAGGAWWPWIFCKHQPTCTARRSRSWWMRAMSGSKSLGSAASSWLTGSLVQARSTWDLSAMTVGGAWLSGTKIRVATAVSRASRGGARVTSPSHETILLRGS
ncbi:hypothetical protein P3T30_005682 [Kitasatospora sp. MAP12-9]